MGDSLTFFVIAFFLVISPGANLMLLLKTVTTKGRNAGLLNVSGFVSGVFVHGTLAMLGLSQIIVQSSELFFMIKVIGAIYLAYLGAKIIYQSFIKVSSQSDTTLPEKKEQSIIQSFSEGFLTQVLNPKGVLFYLSIFPQFIDFHSHAYFKAFELISIHAGLMIVWFGSTCFIVSNIKYLQYNNKITRWVQRLCGSALLIFSILLLKQ